MCLVLERQHLRKLKTILQQVRHRIIYIFIGFVLVIAIGREPIYLVLAPCYIWYLLQIDRKIIGYITIIGVIYYGRVYYLENQVLDPSAQYQGVVIETSNSNDYSSAVITVNRVKVKVFYESVVTLRAGDSISFYGDLTRVNEKTIPFVFHYDDYVKSNNILYQGFIKDIEIQDHSFHYRVIREVVGSYILSHNFRTEKYILTFVMADKSGFDQELKNEISSLGLSHLFAVSGMHVAFLIVAINFCLMRLHIKKELSQKIVITFLLTYLIITGFTPSVIRAVLLYLFVVINRKYQLELSVLDGLSLIAIGLLLYHPFYYLNPGFTLSFTVTFFILLSHDILHQKHPIVQLLLLGVIGMLATIPSMSQMNYQINLISIVINVLYVLYVSVIVLPFSFIALLVPFIDNIFYFFTETFESSVRFFSQISIVTIPISISHPLWVMGYYFLVYRILKHWEQWNVPMKQLLFLLCYLVILSNKAMIDPVQSVSFVDVYGDASIIKDSFDQCNIVVDTGVKDSFHQLINMLRGMGIKRIDYIIITHQHADHYGELYPLLEHFDVGEVIQSNRYSDLTCGKLYLQFYPKNEVYQNENNNSIVFRLSIANKTYLFTGDIEIERENVLLSYDMKADFLKVAHHGSITSSSQPFLDQVTPKEAFIIVSNENTHGHPSNVIIERFQEQGIAVHQTKEVGTIINYHFFEFHWKRFHIP